MRLLSRFASKDLFDIQLTSGYKHFIIKKRGDNMKKTAVLLISFLLLVSLSACGGKGGGEEDDSDDIITETSIIDPLLVGGIWYGNFKDNIRQDGKFSLTVSFTDLYNFTNTDFNKCSFLRYSLNQYKYSTEKTIEAYTKNGALYSLDDNALIFNYKILSAEYIRANIYDSFSGEFLNNYKNNVMLVTTLENEDYFYVKVLDN